MPKNLVNSTRNLKMISSGPLAGWLHTDYPLGIIDDDPGIIIPGQWWTPYAKTSVLDPCPSGFTQIALPEGARMIYLSDKGSDSNDGLHPDRPKRTAEAAAALIRQGAGDILCLERGSPTTWDFLPFQVRNNLRGGAPGKPTIVTWYGLGSRPRVIAPNMDRTYHSNFWFVGIHFVNPYAEFGNPLFEAGKTKRNLSFLNHTSNVRIEDCKFTGVERVYQSTDGSHMANFADHRNISDYMYTSDSSTSQNVKPSALYSQMIDNLSITESVNDFSGWHPDVVAGTYNGTTVTGAGANMYNHCFYIQNGNPYNGVFLEYNICSRPSSHGWQMRSGGIARRNITCYAAIGGAMGYWNAANPTSGTLPAGRLLRQEENLILRCNGMYRLPNSCQSGVCTPARWGLDYTTKSTESEAIWESIGNVVAETSTLYSNHQSPANPNSSREIWRHDGVYSTTPPHDWILRENNRFYHYTNGTEGNGLYSDPGRSIEGYFSMLAGAPMTYDESMDVLKSRGPYEMRSELSVPAIWEFIMSGYDPA